MTHSAIKELQIDSIIKSLEKTVNELSNLVKVVEQLKARVDELNYKLSETRQDVVNTEDRISRLTICN
jgi:predicted  nucleic acid-binding Zn-ribbon protein